MPQTLAAGMRSPHFADLLSDDRTPSQNQAQLGYSGGSSGDANSLSSSPELVSSLSSSPVLIPSSGYYSGDGAGLHESIKQRRGAETAQQAREREARAAAEESDSSGKPHDKAKARNIIRVGKRRYYTSWTAELRAMLTPLLGQPRLKNGKLNRRFLLKAAGLLVLLLLVLVWLWPSGHSSRVVPVPSTPAYIPTAVRSRLEPHVGDVHGHARALDGRPPLSVRDVTIFTVHTPENEHGHNLHIRALHSWLLRVESPAQIHVYVREFAHCESMADMGVTCRVSGCWDDLFDAPRLTCLFREANDRATSELMLYVDDHVILFRDVLPALLHVGRMEHFVMMGRSQALTLNLDDKLDLETWQHDLESAVFLDSSTEQDMDLVGQAAFENQARRASADGRSLHYMAYARTELDLSPFPKDLLMDSGSFSEHNWESHFLSTLLVQDDVHVIDASAAVTAVEFGHSDPSNHTAIVDAVNTETSRNWTGLTLATMRATKSMAQIVAHLKLGRLENAHYALTGRCPTCQLKENREADLPLILLRVANPARQVIVIASNADYLSLTFNWICRARQLGITNFVLLAEDRVAYRILRKMNIPVVLRKDAPYRKKTALSNAPSSFEFQETLYLRALFMQQVVSLGFSLIMTHLDTLWLMNPQQLLDEPACDMFVQMEKGGGTKSSGGLLTVRANEVGQQFVQDYLVCEQENWNFLHAHGKPRFAYSDDADIDCIELISTRLMRRANLHRCVLDPVRYVTEADFFDRQTPQRRAVWPLFVHLNRAQGVENKTRAFQDWNLWAVDDDAMLQVPRVHDAHSHGELHCVKTPPALPPPAPLVDDPHAGGAAVAAESEDTAGAEAGSSSTVHIVIHLLCSTELKATELTLLSLSQTLFPDSFPRVAADLSITLQQPAVSSPENSRLWVALHALLQEFDWPHGHKTLIVLDRFVGPTDQWLDQWGLRANNEAFLLALKPGQVLSPLWLDWTVQALQHYYFDPFEFDPQLMAISLMHQLTITGESPSERFGSRVPSQELANAAAEMATLQQSSDAGLNGTDSSGAGVVPGPLTHHLYLYQLVPLSGTLFFPRHFATFLQWFLAQNVSDSSAPCVPTLLSNDWWLADPSTNWWVWLQRFTFESGWYALYTNFHAADDRNGMDTVIDASGAVLKATEAPRALLVDDALTAGSLVISLLKHLGPRRSFFPPRRDLSLWDLHFKPFVLPPHMLGRRKFMFPPLPSSTSLTRAAEIEALLHEQGDLVEEPMGLASLRPRDDASVLLTLAGRRSVHDDHGPHDEALESPELAESDISHLDVMIESMIQEMEEVNVGEGGAAAGLGERLPGGGTSEHDDETAARGVGGKPDIGELRALAASRFARRKSLLQPHRAHHVRPIRGADGLPRCYTIQQAADVEEKADCQNCFHLHPTLRNAVSRQLAKTSLDRSAAYKALRTRAIEAGLPIPRPPPEFVDPLQTYLTGAPISAEDLYNLMYSLAKPMLPTRDAPYDEKVPGSPRFVLYQPVKPASFDNHLRGIYFTALLALLSNRVLLIDLPDLHLQYECPFKDAEWEWSKFAPLLQDVSRDEFDSKRAAELRTASLDQLYSKVLLVHTEPVTHDRVLFKNLMYKTGSASMFGSSSRMRRTGALMRLLLGKPKPLLLTAAADMQRSMGLLDVGHVVSVHVAVAGPFMTKPATRSDPLPGVPLRYWDCIRSFLLSQGWVADDVSIVFSTNRPSPLAYALAAKELARFGRVVTLEDSWNANRTTGGASSATTSSSLLVDRASGQRVLDPMLLLGYQLGESDISVSSGTTFGIFYAARTGFTRQALIVKLAQPPKKGQTAPATPEEDYCGPMHRLDQPLQEDIIY